MREPSGVFNVNEVAAWVPKMDKNSLTRWIAKGYLVPLRKGWYDSVKPTLMFGYKPVLTPDKRAWSLAHPEKALLDFLYLNPQYKTKQDMEDLRFDEDFLRSELNHDRLSEYLHRFNSKALTDRIATLRKVYAI